MVTILLDACAGLGTETGGGIRSGAIHLADLEIEVYLY